MNFFTKITPAWILRLALGAMYLYSGYDLFLHPSGWTWAVPFWFGKFVESFIALDIYLKLQGAAEFLLALVFLSWFLPERWARWAALISAAELLFILLFSPQFSITFRDIGVFGASFALFILLTRKNGEQK
jgi:hypothetical protein